MGTALRPATRPVTQEALLSVAQFALRDAIDAFPNLPQRQRRDVVTATAAYLADLRAAGVRTESAITTAGALLGQLL